MLTNKRISIIADTIVSDVKIATYGAVIDADMMDMSLTSRHIDKEACKTYRDMVRADQAAFEDYAYDIQDKLNEIAVSEE